MRLKISFFLLFLFLAGSLFSQGVLNEFVIENEDSPQGGRQVIYPSKGCTPKDGVIVFYTTIPNLKFSMPDTPSRLKNVSVFDKTDNCYVLCVQPTDKEIGGITKYSIDITAEGYKKGIIGGVIVSAVETKYFKITRNADLQKMIEEEVKKAIARQGGNKNDKEGRTEDTVSVPEKLYYDENGIGCSRTNAAYYRIVNYDAKGKPVGKIKDYFITGELQTDIEGATYIDKNEDSDSKFTGYCIGYYKSGAKQVEVNFNIYGELDGTCTTFYENGKIQSSELCHDGVLNGESIVYYENGKIQGTANYSNGKLTDNFLVRCDESGECVNTLDEDFNSEESIYQWFILDNNEEFETKIIPEKGLLVKSKTENGGVRETVSFPLNATENFTISTTVDFIDGATNNGHGLIWGFKDWDNYNYFIIGANGVYKIAGKTDGKEFQIITGRENAAINQNKASNKLAIRRDGNKLHFDINETTVHSCDFRTFSGNQVGYFIGSKQEVLFKNLLIEQSIAK